mmetsp:Transcript_73828/g.108388  ORF Transcript_73828/g.108388 Transcript_73828/m.108388 type:complete len:116 (+) Transcript_73828:96-443(+)
MWMWVGVCSSAHLLVHPCDDRADGGVGGSKWWCIDAPNLAPGASEVAGADMPASLWGLLSVTYDSQASIAHTLVLTHVEGRGLERQCTASCSSLCHKSSLPRNDACLTKRGRFAL